MSADWTKALKGRQVTPVSIADVCTYGSLGKVLDVNLNRVVVRWAGGRVSEHYQADLELVPAPERLDKEAES